MMYGGIGQARWTAKITSAATPAGRFTQRIRRDRFYH